MKRSIARKWAEMLESGEIKQAKGQLRKGDAMCCLGVLCNLHAQDNPEYAAAQKYKKYYGGNSDTPPQAVLEWAGLATDLPYTAEHPKGLANLNDNEGYSFEQIAKIIRKHWKEL